MRKQWDTGERIMLDPTGMQIISVGPDVARLMKSTGSSIKRVAPPLAAVCLPRTGSPRCLHGDARFIATNDSREEPYNRRFVRRVLLSTSFVSDPIRERMGMTFSITPLGWTRVARPLDTDPPQVTLSLTKSKNYIIILFKNLIWRKQAVESRSHTLRVGTEQQRSRPVISSVSGHRAAKNPFHARRRRERGPTPHQATRKRPLRRYRYRPGEREGAHPRRSKNGVSSAVQEPLRDRFANAPGGCVESSACLWSRFRLSPAPRPPWPLGKPLDVGAPGPSSPTRRPEVLQPPLPGGPSLTFMVRLNHFVVEPLGGQVVLIGIFGEVAFAARVDDVVRAAQARPARPCSLPNGSPPPCRGRDRRIPFDLSDLNRAMTSLAVLAPLWSISSASLASRPCARARADSAPSSCVVIRRFRSSEIDTLILAMR